jgi:hypothetical protein
MPVATSVAGLALGDVEGLKDGAAEAVGLALDVGVAEAVALGVAPHAATIRRAPRAPAGRRGERAAVTVIGIPPQQMAVRVRDRDQGGDGPP